jgi:hypothetical protein
MIYNCYMNSVHPEDSLDNLSNLQLNRQKQLFSQVKQQFSRGLEKLQTAETREIVTYLPYRLSRN